MKYVPPYGRESEGDSATYVNGDPSIGRQGSIPPANAFEHPMREIVHVIEKNVMVPDSTDLYQLIKAVRSQRANYAEDTGSANNLSVALDPPLSAYTLGLMIRVRVKTSNTGASRINAGAGLVPIRKMNGADTAVNDLSAGAIVTLVYDGTVFQLTNFGGAGGTTGGDTEVIEVKVPYCVDQSTTPGIIRANFNPAITVMNAGDEIAVKIANTAPGPTIMYINGIAQPFHLAPNTGGEMLQGDLHAGAIVIFFYDGNYLYFAPDPSIDQSVTYTIGPGQHWATVDQAMQVLGRKTITPVGFVTLQLAQQYIPGVNGGAAVFINHPNTDRIMLVGTMIGPRPNWDQYAQSGNDPASRARDAAANIQMLRSRYGTEIHCGTTTGSACIVNAGPGVLRVVDILLTGNQMVCEPPGIIQEQYGISVWGAGTIWAQNIVAWGIQMAFYAATHYDMYYCTTSGCGFSFVANAGGSMGCSNCFAMGSDIRGFESQAGQLVTDWSKTIYCGSRGVLAVAAAVIYFVRSDALGSAWLDEYATGNAVIWNIAGAIGSTSPAINGSPGNANASITWGAYPTGNG